MTLSGMHWQAKAEAYPKPIPGTRYTGQARFQQGTTINDLPRANRLSGYMSNSIEERVRLMRRALHSWVAIVTLCIQVVMAEAAAVAVAAAAGEAAGAEVVALAVAGVVASPAGAAAPATLSSLARRRDSVSMKRQLTATCQTP